jgi:hypothetical protein
MRIPLPKMMRHWREREFEAAGLPLGSCRSASRLDRRLERDLPAPQGRTFMDQWRRTGEARGERARPHPRAGAGRGRGAAAPEAERRRDGVALGRGARSAGAAPGVEPRAGSG